MSSKPYERVRNIVDDRHDEHMQYLKQISVGLNEINENLITAINLLGQLNAKTKISYI